MKQKIITICAMLSVILLSTSVATAMTTVDPDAFAENADISNSFSNVTLSSVGGGWDDPSGAIFAINPSGRSYDFDPSTGDLAFGTDDGTYPHLFWGRNLLRFRADFAVLATEVSLDFIGNDDPLYMNGDIGELKAYDSGDNLLDSAFTSSLWKDDVEKLTVSDLGGIAYILAYGSSTDTLGLDNMQWEPIPAPGAILLGSLGVGLVGWLRRRRTL